MKYLPTNTLAYFNAAYQTHCHDLSNVPVSVFAAATKDFRQNCGLRFPNDDAVTFYTLNHCASIVRKSFTPNEPLPEWARRIMETYTNVCMEQGERLLHYILCITTRELRHLKLQGKTPTFWAGMDKAGGIAVREFIKSNCHLDETAAVHQYMNHPPAATVGEYVAGVSRGFWKGWGDYSHENITSWSGGYGGPHWAMVTDAVVAYLTGVTSLEMLVDTGYALAHNGGPIFNKGMMYSDYDTNFITILDVQRSGQMLDLIHSTQNFGVKKTVEAQDAVALLFAHRPQDFKGSIDWTLVSELRPLKEKQGSPTKYNQYINAPAPKPATVKKAVAPKPPTPKKTTVLLHGQPATITGTYQVFPKQTVTVVTRKGQ